MRKCAQPAVIRKGPIHGAAMSFQEIAEVLGTTNQNVWDAYRRGITKLRKYHPRTLERLKEISSARQEILNRPAETLDEIARAS